MKRSGSGDKGVLALLAVIVAGAGAAYWFLGRAPQPAPDKPTGPEKPPVVAHQVDVKDLATTDTLEVPYILWGGDVATFVANGGARTKDGSLFSKQGLKIDLRRGDDFGDQVKRYKEGTSPFLRGTMSMLGQVSEEIGTDPRTQPVVFLQLTWSAGDHMVARADCKTLNDLRGKKIALQKGGPHVGMLNDILRTAQYTWKDVTVVYTDDVSGDKGPAELFRKDASIDACFAITPEMTELTGGLDKTGTGDKKTVRNAHVLVSTASMLRSIADVYACRKDFFDKNREVIEKFTAAYLKGTEELMAQKKASKDKPTDGYKQALTLTRELFGTDAKDDETADGLISDAVFVGLPGNYSFFKDNGNLSGFAAKEKAALDLAINLGDAKERHPFVQANLDYARVKSIGGLTALVEAPKTARFTDNPKEKSTIYFFSVSFRTNESTFPEAQYGEHFQRAVEQASLFGNAIVSVRGHADPFNVANTVKKVGLQKGILSERGGKFFLRDGSEFDLNDMKKVVELVKKENLGSEKVKKIDGGEGGELDKEIAFLQKLSDDRAKAVRSAIEKYAKNRGYQLDVSQIKPVGLGCTEPNVVFPKVQDDWSKNRRVEFRIIQVEPEDIRAGEIDF